MRYVALGDSFTEGVGDDLPGDRVRGWADLVAAGLAVAGEDIWYSNLAIRGRLIQAIVDQQLEPALALDPPPTLMTFSGGGNDMLRAGFDLDHVMDLVDHVATRTAEQGIRLILLSGGDPTDFLPRGRTISGRSQEFMDRIQAVADAHDHVTFVDNYTDKELRRPEYWAPDRLHLNAMGHARVAARVLTAIGVETELPVAGNDAALKRGVLVEARYIARYVLPWIARRVTRRSSGDGRVPKFANWTKVDRPS